MTLIDIDAVTTLAPARETRAASAPVESGYRNLDSTATKTLFTELDTALCSLAGQVFHTLNQITPQLAEMQALLSQRGKKRKHVLKEAGLPSWPDYGEAYATKLDCSFRTIQDHITCLRRTGKSGPSQSTKTRQQRTGDGGTRRSKPWHADAKDSRSLAEAQLAVNEMIAAYEAGADLEPAYMQYKNVAVSPEKLNVIFEAATGNSTATDVDAEVKKKLVTVVEAAERYIRALEGVVHSPSVALTERQKEVLQKPMEGWRGILRFARGTEAERKGKGVSKEDVPILLREVA